MDTSLEPPCIDNENNPKTTEVLLPARYYYNDTIKNSMCVPVYLVNIMTWAYLTNKLTE